MAKLTLVKNEDPLVKLESFGIATRLPERLVVMLQQKRDEQLKAYPEEYKKKNPKADTSLPNMSSTLCLLVFMLSGVAALCMWIGQAIRYLFFPSMADALLPGIFFTALSISCFFAAKVLMTRQRRNSQRLIDPGLESIRQTCEQQIGQLTSDPLFLLEQARIFCEEQKILINEDLKKIDEELEQKVSNPLADHKRKLTKWKASLARLSGFRENQLPDKPTLIANAEISIAKYRELVSQTEPIKLDIEAKRAVANIQIENLEKGIIFLIELEAEYKDLDEIMKDMQAEFGREYSIDEYIEKCRMAAQEISNSLDERLGEIYAIQMGIITMAKSLPEPDKFCTNAQLQLVGKVA